MPLARLTLVAHDPQHAPVDWNDEPTPQRRLVFVDDDARRVGLAIEAALAEPTLDTERVILDRVATAEMFLEVLAALPPQFGGDVLRIDERGRGFLSATGRGGDRVLYALDPGDVRFYLATHGLIHAAECELLERTA
jgi:hypothetical protein